MLLSTGGELMSMDAQMMVKAASELIGFHAI
jgi:hypothetical protein